MGITTYAQLIVVSALLGCAVGSWRRSRSAGSLLRQGQAFVERNLAWVEDRFVPVVEGRLRRRERTTAVVALLGAVTFVLVPIGDDATAPTVAPMLVVFGLGVAVLAVQSTLEAARPLPLDETSVRTARVRTVSVADLVPPHVRGISLLATVTLAANAIVLVLALRQGWLEIRAGSAILIVLAATAIVVAAGLSELSAHRVVAMPESAGDAAQLYWQDALRAESATQGYEGSSSSAALLWAAASASLLRTTGSAPDWLSTLGLVSLGGAAALLVALGVVALRTRNATPWFRTRLWPALGPGEVLTPGRMLVP